jgi:hypothetical protein
MEEDEFGLKEEGDSVRTALVVERLVHLVLARKPIPPFTRLTRAFVTQVASLFSDDTQLSIALPIGGALADCLVDLTRLSQNIFGKLDINRKTDLRETFTRALEELGQ